MSKQANQNQDSAQSWGRRGTAQISIASALSFDDVCVSIGGKKILNDVSFDLTPGEVVCLLGESGSGKSTILRVAAGIQKIDSGAVRVNETIMSSSTQHVPPQKRHVGLMFQDFALFPHMSLEKNVMFGMRGLSKADAKKQAQAALDRVGLGNRAKDYPHMLSGGQKQRLALARSFAPRPGILMLDEPFSSLDARLRETVRTEALAILRETRATTIIVTHDPEEAMILADRIALLRDGKLVQLDRGDDLYRHPVDLDAARFLSPLAEISATAQDGKADTPFGTIPVPEKQDGQQLTIAIRPSGPLTLQPNAAEDETAQPIIGRVVTKRSALGSDLLELVFAGIEEPVHVRLPSNEQIKQGSDLPLYLNAEHVLVFDAV